ncbi:MFS transporter, partial [Pseudomonas oryzihabitans]
MNDMPLSHSQTPPRTATLSPALLGLLATGAGLSVANLYYSQPLLGTLASDLPATAADVGLIPTLTQLGYALGLLLLAPLGDRFDRRRIILAKLGILLLALLGASLAPGLHALLLASLVTGLAATVAQDLVPAAATLAPPAERGRIVGTVMTGLLLGILLSRVVSGLVGELFGWRTLYLLSLIPICRCR